MPKAKLEIVWCRKCGTNHPPGKHVARALVRSAIEKAPSARQAPSSPLVPKRGASIDRKRKKPNGHTKPAKPKRKHNDLSHLTPNQKAEHRRAQVRAAVQRHRDKQREAMS